MKIFNIRSQDSDFFWKIYDFLRYFSHVPAYYARIHVKTSLIIA